MKTGVRERSPIIRHRSCKFRSALVCFCPCLPNRNAEGSAGAEPVATAPPGHSEGGGNRAVVARERFTYHSNSSGWRRSSTHPNPGGRSDEERHSDGQAA